MDYCDKLLKTPAILLYQDPKTKEVEVLGTKQGKQFLQQHPYLLTRFDCFLATEGKQ